MQDTAPSEPGARVITVRVRGRLTTLFGVLLLVALLPFLAASAPRHASVVLAAGAQQPAPSRGVQPDARALGGGAGTAGAPSVGGAAGSFGAATDPFLFPSLQLPPPVAGQTLGATVGGPAFIWPVQGPESSGFGPRIHPVLGRAMFHTGIDLVVACGTPIRAAADGQVVYAAITPSWGRRVIIQHTPGLETGYAHMSRFLVQSGETVKQGDVIGLVGTTGWSTGCHLHFDVIVDGQYVDPAPYLGLPPSTTARIPYYAAPHLVLDHNGTVVHTVEDGDVPIPPASDSPTHPGTTSPAPEPTTSQPTTSQPTTTSPTGTPTTSPPTTTSPTGTPTTSPPTTTPPTGTPTTSQPTGTPSTSTSPPSTPTTTAPTTTQPTTTQPTTTQPTTTEPTTMPTDSSPADASTSTGPAASTPATSPAATTTAATTAATSSTTVTTSTATTLATEPTKQGVAETEGEPSTA